MKRSRIRPRSDKRTAVNVLRAEAQEAAWGPRPWRCQFRAYADVVGAGLLFSNDDLRCFGEVNGHEILSRSRSTKDENLIDVSGQVPLCNFHNGWVSEHDELATKIGLSRRLEVGE